MKKNISRLARFLCTSLLIITTVTQFKSLAATSLPDAIRSGGPSRPHQTKIAVVVSQRSYADKAFTLDNEKGETVFTGKLKAANTSEPWAYAASADFSGFKSVGRYRIHVDKLKSEPWVIDAKANSELVIALLGIFLANRDGKENSSLHKPAHLHDATVKGGRYDNKKFDFTGGWMDAGDQIHFTDTTAYAAIILQIAAKLDPVNADALNNEADVGIRWLLKAHPRPDLFIGQIGDMSDHALGFRDPATDDQSKLPGIGHRLAYPSVLSGMMGKTAAALAFAAERNSGKARRKLLTQAKQWYEQGKANHSDQQLPGHFYDNLTWHDDMSIAAVMLWRLTGKTQYQQDAYRYLDDIDHTLSVASVGVLTAANLCGALNHNATKNIKIQKFACDYLHTAAQEAISTATIDNAPWGTPGHMYWGQSGFNGSHGAIIAFAKRANLIKDASVASRARDWLLGLNPWGASFVVGYGLNSPATPHHWASVFGNNLPKGAVVGGAAAMTEMKKTNFSKKELLDSDRAVYSPKIESYANSEPSLVYSANSILLITSLNTLKN